MPRSQAAPRRTFAALLLSLVSTVPVPAQPRPGPQEAELLALDRAYVEAWKQEGTERQAAAVLALFADDAVILPGAGLPPRQGGAELETFWFPAGAPPTEVLEFRHDPLGVDVGEELAAVYGRARLVFRYAGEETEQEGNYLLVARRTDTGEWRITRMAWSNRRLP